jgi:hypothetical protein
MVSHGGTSYMCISNVSGTTTPNADTSNWDSMAVKGDTGNTGSQGVTGNTGSQGPIGNTGPSGFPSGGTAGQVVTNTSSGAGTWQDAAGGNPSFFYVATSQGQSGRINIGWTSEGGGVDNTGIYDDASGVFTKLTNGIRVNVAGSYLISGAAIPYASGGNMYMYLMSTRGQHTDTRSSGASVHNTASASIVMKLNANDEIWMDTGSYALHYGNYSHISGFKIS